MGNSRLLEEHWGEYSSDVFNFMRRMGAGPNDAEDLAQETFLRALRGAERFRGDSSVRTWLFGIARNVFREWVRHRRHRRTERLTDAADRVANPAANVPWVEIETVLASLNTDDREALVMRFMFDLTGTDIAVALGISHEAARQRIRRARAEFKRNWEDS